MVAPKGPGPPGPPPVLRGSRRAVARRGGAGRRTGNAWPLTLSYAKAIGGTRAGALRYHLQGGDRRRTCSASRPCSAVVSPGKHIEPGSTRSSRRATARDRLLRVPARDEADRGPHVRRRHLEMYWSVSDTAEFGGYTRGRGWWTSGAGRRMRRILAEVRNGTFTRELIEEFDSGRPNFLKRRGNIPEGPDRAGPGRSCGLGQAGSTPQVTRTAPEPSVGTCGFAQQPPGWVAPPNPRSPDHTGLFPHQRSAPTHRTSSQPESQGL